MGSLGWIVRILVILFVIRLVLRFLSSVRRAATPPGSSQRPNQPATRDGGQLVRDPNCGTYIAIGRALREGAGDKAVYFCSEACRHAWANRKAG